jgi:hypothetical protein
LVSTVQHPTTPPQSVALPSTCSAADVIYETESSPVSTRFDGATEASYDDDDYVDADTGAVSEGEVRAFARKPFVRLKAHMCHHMFTNVAFSMLSMVCVK